MSGLLLLNKKIQGKERIIFQFNLGITVWPAICDLFPLMIPILLKCVLYNYICWY